MSTPAEFTEQELIRDLRGRIDDLCYECTYDYRQAIPKSIVEQAPHIMDPYCVYIGSLRHSIVTVLKPKTIYEVGIGWGLAARAFLAGKPDVSYYGIDNESMGVPIAEALSGLPTAKWSKCDSASLEGFVHPDGPIDLIHIDGGHSRAHEAEDIRKALRSGANWMLVDDVHDRPVLAAFGDAMATHWKGGVIPMMYFERSTSCVLVHTGAYS